MKISGNINNINNTNAFNGYYQKDCNQQNFGSNINLINSSKFFRESQKIQGHIDFVDYPWTSKEITRGKQVVTEGIKTCTAGGILVETVKGLRDVVMFHLNPDIYENNDFDLVQKSLTEKIGGSKPLQAFMVGSKDSFDLLKYSGEYFDNLWQKVISKFNVPTTFLKGIPTGGYKVDLYCDVPNDTWFVSCSVRDKFSPFDKARKEFLGFKDAKVSDFDKLILD